jgi:hypothetical protein
MAEGANPDSKLRTAVIVFFPMFIAALSLVTSIYNGYLNNKFVTLIQGNVGRVEYLRTCRDIIDAYFQVKLRTDLLRADPVARADALNAVAKFGALGTYLANLRNEDIRREYTHLTWELDAIAKRALDGAAADDQFAKADGMFSKLNEDCIKSAQSAPL